MKILKILKKHSFHLPIGKRLRVILVLETVLLTCGYLLLSSAYTKLNRHHFDTNVQQFSNTLMSTLRYCINTLDVSTKYPLSYTQIKYRNDPLWKYLKNPESLQKNYIEFNQQFKDISAQTLFQFPSLDSIFLLDPEGSLLAYSHSEVSSWSLTGHTSLSWFSEVLDANGSLLFLSEEEAEEFLVSSPGILYGSRVLSDITTLKPVCVTLNGIRLTDLTSSFHSQQLYEDQSFALYNQKGQLIFNDRDLPPDFIQTYPPSAVNEVKNLTLDRQDFVFHTHYDKDTGIYLVIRTPADRLYQNSMGFYLFFWLCIPLVIVSNLIFFNGITSSIAKPLNRLVSACRKIGEGNFSERIPTTTGDELGYVTDSFNLMSSQVEKLINEVYIRKMAEQDLELQMLRSQINPHFLYNTLESMRMSAYSAGYTEHAEMCRLLAKILRYGVSTQNHLVPVEEEIRHLQDYVALLEYRFHDRIQVQIQIDPTLFPFMVIKLFLQPLVENCINHGILGMNSIGLIQIWGYLEGECLIFNVSDNGAGMAPETLRLLRGYLDNENQAFTSIGLKNIHRRIRLYYGDRYGLSIDSRPGRGTSVTIRLPYKVQEENNRIHTTHEKRRR